MSTYTPDEMLRVQGFKVEITGAGSGGDVDSAWESCSGGSLNIERADPTDPGLSIGTLSVETITLRGPLTGGRKWLAAALGDGKAGKRATFDLSLVELLRKGTEGRRFKYRDCFVTRYVFPKLSVDGSELDEEVHIKPNRLELA